MSRIAPPAEKVDATARIYRELSDELRTEEWEGGVSDAVVVALIDASVRIALATDTRDMGIIGLPDPLPFIQCPHRLMHPDRPADECTLAKGHFGDHDWAVPIASE